MENFIFYLVLNSLHYGKKTYARDDVFAERADVDVSDLVKAGIIVDVNVHIAQIEADAAAQIAEIEAKAKAKKDAVASLVAQVNEKKAGEESRIKAEEDARKALEEAEATKAAEQIATHLSKAGVGITGPMNTSHE